MKLLADARSDKTGSAIGRAKIKKGAPFWPVF
jgi:hypothetical protein